MYVLIEHYGTQSHNEMAKRISEILEEDYGTTCDFTIGSDSSQLILYDENLNTITTISSTPKTDESLRLIFRLTIEDKE